MTEASFQLNLRFASDWHIGTGSGRHGSIDRVLHRDLDGLPEVPAKTLVGLWRDAAERLAHGLGGGGPWVANPWRSWVEMLFGNEPARRGAQPTETPVPARLSLDPAGLPSDLRARMIDPAPDRPDPSRQRLRTALGLIRPGVRIEAATGTAMNDHLRFVELGRADTPLVAGGTILLPANDDEARLLLALARAALLLIERLGGKRRRGAGKLHPIELVWREEKAGRWPNNSAAIALLRSTTKPHLAPMLACRHRGSTAGAPAAVGRAEAWRVVSFRIRLSRPVVIAAEVQGNVVTCLDHVPGSALLPFVHDRLAGLGLDPGALIRAGNLVVLPAVPCLDGERARPAPFVFARVKDTADSGDCRNRLVDDEEHRLQLKPLRGGWVAATRESGELSYLERTPMVHRTHGTVDDRHERPTAGVGGVFTYEALAPGLELASEVWVRDAEVSGLAEGWWKELAGEWRLGTAAKDDYGPVQIEAETSRRESAEDASEGDSGEGADRRKVITVWLLTDLLLRGDDLGPATKLSDLAKAIACALTDNVSLVPAYGPLGPRAELRARRHESWHRGWGRPRPSLIAIRAGSCAVFLADRPIAPAALCRIEREGLGERRAEGFGRVTFNDPLLGKTAGTVRFTAAQPTIRKVEFAKGPLREATGPIAVFAQRIEQAAWRRVIEETAEQLAGEAVWRRNLLGIEGARGDSRPGPSQLGTLRMLVEGWAREPGTWLPRIESWLKKLGDIGGHKGWPESSLDKLRALFLDDVEGTRIWQMLGLNEATVPRLAAGSGRPSQELRTLALHTAVIAAIRAHRRATEDAPESGEG